MKKKMWVCIQTGSNENDLRYNYLLKLHLNHTN